MSCYNHLTLSNTDLEKLSSLHLTEAKHIKLGEPLSKELQRQVCKVCHDQI